MTMTPGSKWLVPSWLVVQGVLILGAKWIGGDAGEGVGWLAAAVVAAALFLAGGRSDVVRIARGDRIDERQLQIDLFAVAITLSLLLLGVFGVFLYEAANGRSGAAFGVLLAVATVTYLVSLAVLNRRT